MLKQLTYEAWSLYLKILDIERYCRFQKKTDDRVSKLLNRAHQRYERRRDAWVRSGYR